MAQLDLNRLCDNLGYKFKNLKLLDKALRHRSLSSNNNERLEFLGDAIVNFLIAEALFARFEKAKEGELSRLRASLVRGDSLAELARELKIGEYLRLGVGEQKSGGKMRNSILADAMEAIIAAIYLDSNIEQCRECIMKWFSEKLVDNKLKKNLKDPKTRLQEYLQAHRFPLPSYSIKKISGDPHDQLFCIECHVEGIDLVTSAEGSSRRRAEQQSAEKFLQSIDKKDFKHDSKK